MRRRLRLLLPVVTLVLLLTVASAPAVPASASRDHACPTDLSAWAAHLHAAWLDCHRLADLTTTGNPYTDTNGLTGMGYPPPGSGTLNSKYSRPTTPAVPGLQLDGYFADDDCNLFQPESAESARNGAPFIKPCRPVALSTCAASGCHRDAQFVIRIPDGWHGQLLTSGTPGIRDAFASDFIFSDYALEKGWAYVSQDKGNMGANFFQDGCDERGSCASGSWPGACTASSTAWCPAAAVQEWTYRVKQATREARSLLNRFASGYGLGGVLHSYVTGISNGGYQTRRALETDTENLYDGGVDWEGTLFLPSLPAGVRAAGPTTGFNLFTYLPAALANEPGAVAGDQQSVAALAARGFNPQSQPLWPYHYTVYWGLTQKIYRLEFDPEYTGYTCSGPAPGPSCVSPPALVVPPQDPDASYDYQARLAQLPILRTRLSSAANTGDIKHPLITLHGDQDSLLPIQTDSDLYAQMVRNAGHQASFRYYVVSGGNHVDAQFDDHYGLDAYGNTVLRPMLPCVRASLDAVDAWVSRGVAPPPSHTIPRPPGASADQLANTCDVASSTTAQPGPPSTTAASTTATTTPFSSGPRNSPAWGALVVAACGFLFGLGSLAMARRRRRRP